MRLKFRAKSVKTRKWVYGEFPLPASADPITLDISKFFEFLKIGVLEPKTLGQFSGQSDINGKEMYTADILKNVKNGLAGEIRFGNGGFYFYNEEDHELFGFVDAIEYGNIDFSKEYEIIGDVHNNPKFLEKNK